MSTSEFLYDIIFMKMGNFVSPKDYSYFKFVKGEEMNKSKVMIVDDCELTLNITRDVLEEGGFEVITRARAIGTTAAILKEKPNYVLMDVFMPSLSGPKIVKLVKNTNSSVKILLHSAKDDEELKKLVDDCGADGYIKKGSDSSKLLKQLRSTIEN